MNDLYFTAKNKKGAVTLITFAESVYHPQFIAVYHPSENEYISLSGEYIIKPQERGCTAMP